jgi:hypothetical protein
MKPQPTISETISMTRRVGPSNRSIRRPTRIISPDRNVCARPRKAVAAMHHEAKSSPAGRFTPSGRPADRIIIKTKIAMRNAPAA